MQIRMPIWSLFKPFLLSHLALEDIRSVPSHIVLKVSDWMGSRSSCHTKLVTPS
ncbi:unnamed protein product [Hymenolepis diminuta]|uniref:Uncharacterized protein n=1 Tax=Hymenolepis diminuta TaxID=6216 RepID=A0A564YVJ9_HYMDI|nr:unnamed protein product [Hymenolepis diminuta]VUZ51307.1 unnamed protein product [Hymenolepis diminuta]VUZ57833.1 unnamed protein product [Hymenolepis diminuta]